ncbi:MAG: 3-isopropylmalate dehydratase small subunit [Nanoarchaeota archaeon]|nr:3-isopropylmalate dehydratase small subunit [Nanoarchaeota archaeon]
MVELISEVEGTGIFVQGNDIDTDRIIPARYMKEVTFAPLGEFAFYDARFSESGDKKDHPFNDSRFKGASILVVNKNFGCGSSREHAPQSLLRWGIKAVIGESFAEIFAGNCTMLGIPTLVLDPASITFLMDWIKEHPSEAITLDAEKQQVIYSGKSVDGTMVSSSRKALLEGTWDSTSLLLEGKDAIKEVADRLDALYN